MLLLPVNTLFAQEIVIATDSANREFISMNGLTYKVDTAFNMGSGKSGKVLVGFDITASTSTRFKDFFKQLLQFQATGQALDVIDNKVNFRLEQLYERTYRRAIIKEILFLNLAKPGRDFGYTTLQLRVTIETSRFSVINTNNTFVYNNTYPPEKSGNLSASAYTIQIGNLPMGNVTNIKGLRLSRDEYTDIALKVDNIDVAPWDEFYKGNTSIINEKEGKVNILSHDGSKLVIPVKLSGVSAQSFQVINIPGGVSASLISLRCKRITASFNPL